MVPTFGEKSYKKWKDVLKLPTPEERRITGDMITTCTSPGDHSDANTDQPCEIRKDFKTSRHNRKLGECQKR